MQPSPERKRPGLAEVMRHDRSNHPARGGAGTKEERMTTKLVNGVEVRTDRPMLIEVFGGPFEVMLPSDGEFHLQDGLTFANYDEDRVIIRRWQKRDDGWHFTSMLVSNAQWGSVVGHLHTVKRCWRLPGAT